MRVAVAAALLFLAAPAVAQARPQRALLLSCDRAERAATFAGRADRVEGSERMAMSFTLQSRAPRERWRRLRLPGFSDWQTSEPGRSRYVYTKRVEGLVGPSSYRVVVRFRWLDAAGEVVRRAHAVSRRCRQPDPRPNLRVTSLTVRRHRYSVTVRNSGRSPAGPSRLRLDLGDGRPPLSALVGPLDARSEQTIVLTGRRCARGSLLTATADAADTVDERREDDDVLVAACR